MTIQEFLKTTSMELGKAGINSARLEALILLEDAFHQDRALVLAHPEKEIPAPIFAELYKKRLQREQHTPLAYIRNKAPFYGREFHVDERVLVPRPESEAIINLLKDLAPKKSLQIADIGTGSGCLGITAALELSNARVQLYDIDQKALAVAKNNAAKYHVNVTLTQQDLLEQQTIALSDVIVANLPYVPTHMKLNQAATHEPPQAIFSGIDGLDHYKRFWTQVMTLSHKPVLIITETLPSQHHTNALLARGANYYLAQTEGFAQAFRPID